MAPIIFEVQNKIDFTGLFSVKDSEDNHIECDLIGNGDDHTPIHFHVDHNNLLSTGDILYFNADSKKLRLSKPVVQNTHCAGHNSRSQREQRRSQGGRSLCFKTGKKQRSLWKSYLEASHGPRNLINVK